MAPSATTTGPMERWAFASSRWTLELSFLGWWLFTSYSGDLRVDISKEGIN